MPVICKSNSEIELIRESALLVSATLTKVANFLKPGISTLDIDKMIESFIVANQATPSFKNYHGYPYASCISVNDAVVHGFPSSAILKEGDVISVDVGVYKNGFHGDSAYTFIIGDAPGEVKQLLQVTKQSLYLGIEKAITGNRVGDISNAIQDYTEVKHGYGVVRELVGHGLGRQLHEDPQVPNYGRKGTGTKLKEGTVIAIEPMVNLGTREVFTESDGWTIKTRDGKVSAHFEHTVCVRKQKADILSSFAEIEKAERENPHLWSSTVVVTA